MKCKSHYCRNRKTRLFEKAWRYLRCRNRRQFVNLISRHRELLGCAVDDVSLIELGIWRGLTDWVEAMLRMGADPNLVEVTGQETPLIHAAVDNKVQIVALLLDFGADIEMCNRNRETPLGYACAYQAVDVVRLLCQRGADVNGTENWGRSYLWSVERLLEREVPDPRDVEIHQILSSFGARSFELEPPPASHLN